MSWQFTSQQPIYLQIMDAIEQRIFSGTYDMGEKLPSVRDLALEASVNPNTMQRALSELEERLLINTQRNSGRTVTDNAEVIQKARSEKANKLAEGYLGDMASLGFQAKEAIGFLTRKGEKEVQDGNHTDDTRAE